MQGYNRQVSVDGLNTRRQKLVAFALFLAITALVFWLQDVVVGAVSDVRELWLVVVPSTLIMTCVVVVLHETAHFVVAWARGMSPHFVFTKVKGIGYCPGVLLKVGKPHNRSDVFWTVVAPQVFTPILLALLIFAQDYNLRNTLFWAAAFNFFGGSFDFWAAIRVVGSPKGTLFVQSTHTETTIYTPIHTVKG